MPLTADERLTLAKVLDFKLSLTQKNTPQLLPLSLYSSELKGTKQIAGCLRRIREKGDLADNEVARKRYFNTLYNQGLVDGSWENPELTDLANHYLEPLDRGVGDAFWQGDEGNAVEYLIIRELARRLGAGEPVSYPFKVAWYGAQTFFDYVPSDELDGVLADRERLLFLFRINSNGWEIGRYFRLGIPERNEFEEVFAKVLSTGAEEQASPIEVAAAQYKAAAEKIQKDVRFRISGFLNAYKRLRDELGAALPRLDRQLAARLNAGNDEESNAASLEAGVLQSASTRAAPLPYPHQLIVTGCPGSGKSFYVEELAKNADYVIRTQFHPESSFFDFVGSYKPQPVYEKVDNANPLEEGDGSAGTRGRPLIDYRYVPGPLMKGFEYALRHPQQNVVVLIEEINRGNAAAIFGDVLQLLDRTETGESRYELEPTPEQRTYLTSQKLPSEKIRLPANLYLWATMNSADQGVYPLDTAFRRRWSYSYRGFTEPCSYQNAVVKYGGKYYYWDSFRGAVNDSLISLGIHEDKLIGPYFLTESQLAMPEALLEKLFLYLWDDVLRFRQDAFFNEKSFSAVTKVWRNGDGTPLKIEMPDPVPSLISEPVGDAANSAGAVLG